MVFAELMDMICHERNLSINEVAEEIGITAPSFRNLLYKKVLKPDGETSVKILSYCKRHSIDTSELDWNEVLYEYFFASGKYTDYKWESDLDRNNYIKVKHKTCGRNTLAPISAFNGRSTLCIHCWFEKFVSEEAYTLSINDLGDGYEIQHNVCGNTYPVTYEQIKQKKYRCPECYSLSLNANSPVEGVRGNYDFVGNKNEDTEPDNSCDKKPIVTIDDLAMSVRTYNNLKRTGFDDITKIIETPIRSLRLHIRPDKDLANILRQLDARGIRKTGCGKDRYPTIDDFIRAHLKCCECHDSLAQEGSDTVACLCKDCIERLQRVSSDKSITIELKNPEYMSYTNGHKGVTIFANLTNRTNTPFKVKLQEFTLTHRSTQKVSDYNYTGYDFDEGYLFPDTIKAVGKIWVTEQWEKQEIGHGDYCVIVLKSQTNNKQYYYKFTYSYAGFWRLYDYYELD